MKSSIKATISAALLIGAGLWSVSPSGATPLTTPHGVNQAGQANSLYEPASLAAAVSRAEPNKVAKLPRPGRWQVTAALRR